MTNDERKVLLEKEERQYRITESFLRSVRNFPPCTEKDVARHMEACADYLDAGHPYDGEMTPFVIGLKKREG